MSGTKLMDLFMFLNFLQYIIYSPGNSIFQANASS